MNLKTFLSIVIVTAVVGFIGLTGAVNAQADFHNVQNNYQSNQHDNGNDCKKDNLKDKGDKCCKNSSGNDHKQYGNQGWNNNGGNGDQGDGSNPSVTPTPSVDTTVSDGTDDTTDNNNGSPCTQNCGNPPTFPGSTTLAPVCSDINTTQAVANPFVVKGKNDAVVNFFITQGNEVNIYYKESTANNWQFAVGNLLPNSDNFISYTITDLKPSVAYDFGIQQVFGCGGGIITQAQVLNK